MFFSQEGGLGVTLVSVSVFLAWSAIQVSAIIWFTPLRFYFAERFNYWFVGHSYNFNCQVAKDYCRLVECALAWNAGTERSIALGKQESMMSWLHKMIGQWLNKANPPRQITDGASWFSNLRGLEFDQLVDSVMVLAPADEEKCRTFLKEEQARASNYPSIFLDHPKRLNAELGCTAFYGMRWLNRSWQ